MADDLKTTTPAEPAEEKTESAEVAATNPVEKPADVVRTDVEASEVPTSTEKEEQVLETKPESSTLETTTANDGNISINQTEAPKENPAPAESKTEEPKADEITPDEPKIEEKTSETPMPVSTEEAPISASDPVVVKPEDVEAAEEPGTEKLQGQIESLTGEIQALEAKIERLTSGSTSATTDTPKPVEAEKPAEEVVKPADMETPEKKLDAPMSAPASTPAPTPIPVMPTPMPTPETKSFGTVGSKPLPQMDSDVEEVHTSAVAVISEVLVILGTILFVVLASTPFFREMVGEDLYQIISSVGWLTTSVTLLLGTLMATFGKAKAAITLIGFVFLLLSAFMYLGMNYPSLLGPLGPMLEGVFGFYK